MPKTGFTIPPKIAEILDKPELQEFDVFMEAVFKLVEGIGEEETGELNEDNIPGHHSGATGGHGNMVQASDPGDANPSSVSVESADAGGTYNAAVQALINELKSDLNTLKIDHNNLVAKLNDKNANERTAGQLV